MTANWHDDDDLNRRRDVHQARRPLDSDLGIAEDKTSPGMAILGFALIGWLIVLVGLAVVVEVVRFLWTVTL